MKIYLIHDEVGVFGAFTKKHKCIKWIKQFGDSFAITYVEIFDDCDPLEGSTMMEVKCFLEE